MTDIYLHIFARIIWPSIWPRTRSATTSSLEAFASSPPAAFMIVQRGTAQARA
eukprot:COSAG03_NODE_16225_length_408_cov_0.601942_1_plen_52_part_01